MKKLLFILSALSFASCKNDCNTVNPLTGKVWVNEISNDNKIVFTETDIVYTVCNCSHSYHLEGDYIFIPDNHPTKLKLTITPDTLTFLAEGGYPTKYYLLH